MWSPLGCDARYRTVKQPLAQFLPDLGYRQSNPVNTPSAFGHLPFGDVLHVLLCLRKWDLKFNHAFKHH